jgi:SAM-dependent methyltransferase
LLWLYTKIMLVPAPSVSHRTRKILTIILSCALVLHILSCAFIYMFKVQSISTTPDPLDYRLAALNMIQYHVFSLAPAAFHAPQLLRTPMYPAILAGTYFLDGQTGFVMIILQSILLIIMGWLLFRLLLAFKVRENIALILTTIYLFEPLQWLYTLQTMTETIASFFVILLLAGALIGKGINDFPRAALFGVGLGLLVFQKPSAMMWVPFLLLLIFIAGDVSNTWKSWRARFARAAVAFALMLLTLTPWLIRNYNLTGHIILSSSGPQNLIDFAGTPDIVPPSFHEPVTFVTYNGNHTNDTWYAYTTDAYPMLLKAQRALLAHADYFSLVKRQLICAPSVWFGITQLQDQEAYGHEYGLIADFVLHPNPARDALLNFIDTVAWTIALLLSLLGTFVLVRSSETRWRFLPLLGMILAAIFINFCASWARVLLPMYPIAFIATGVGIGFLMGKTPGGKRLASTPSLLRRAEHAALSTVTLSGSVLDLGGEKDAGYLSFIQGNFTTIAVNIDEDAKPDIFHDLEKPLDMIKDASYDHVLAMNVLEHIFNYQKFLDEAVRVLKPNGTLVVIVPFLFPVHPSPNDYWRFTHMTLRREFENRGLSEIAITPLGTGVFSARYVMLDRLLPNPLRIFNYYTFRIIAEFLDCSFVRMAKKLGKKYVPADYALGYLITGRKTS